MPKISYSYFNYSVNYYEDLLWRMNLTQSDYQAIASNMNFTRDEIYNFHTELRTI